MQDPPMPCHRLDRQEAQSTARVVVAGRASSLVLVFFSLLISFLSFLVLAMTKWHGINRLRACSRQALSSVVLVMGVIRYTG
jgi:hypothetical protein